MQSLAIRLRRLVLVQRSETEGARDLLGESRDPVTRTLRNLPTVIFRLMKQRITARRDLDQSLEERNLILREVLALRSEVNALSVHRNADRQELNLLLVQFRSLMNYDRNPSSFVEANLLDSSVEEDGRPELRLVPPASSR
jgi:hypothetical protein